MSNIVNISVRVVSTISIAIAVQNTVVGAPIAKVYPYTPPTGQTSVFRTGDDADIEATITAPLRKSGIVNPLVDFFNLLNNNDFDIDKKRFTNTKGGTAYTDVGGGLTSDGAISDYFIDHYTGLGWFRILQANALFNAQIDAALAATFGGFSDWFVPNKFQFESISKHHPGRILQWGASAPYPVPLDNSANNRYTTSTTAVGNTPKYLGGRRDGIMNLDTKTTTTGMGIYCRIHFTNT